jgi:hypothetical protein
LPQRTTGTVEAHADEVQGHIQKRLLHDLSPWTLSEPSREAVYIRSGF